MRRGILLGCDQSQEWMLPWWLSCLRVRNHLPVAFIDFGLSLKAKAWCAENGYLIPVCAPKDFVFPDVLVGERLWDRASSPLCFSKPFALLQTPFDQTIWVDISCEVLGPLEILFQRLACFSVAFAKDNRGDGLGYNSGVIVYRTGASLLSCWAEVCVEQNERFLDDQEALMWLIRERGLKIGEISQRFNWIVGQGVRPEAAVLQWAGEWGRQVIRRQSYNFRLMV